MHDRPSNTSYPTTHLRTTRQQNYTHFLSIYARIYLLESYERLLFSNRLSLKRIKGNLLKRIQFPLKARCSTSIEVKSFTGLVLKGARSTEVYRFPKCKAQGTRKSNFNSLSHFTKYILQKQVI